mgnify:FL=1
MKKILICCNNNFFKKKLKKNNYFFITKKNNLTLKYLNKVNPDKIFFPHWKYKIEKKIFNNFTCIGFHSSPLPYGRGGSPIQNMIIRDFNETEVCAYKINFNFDSGPVYIKKKVKLNGSGEKVFFRIYNLIIKMIKKMEIKLPKPKKQIGKVKYFKRRKPYQSNLLNVKNVKEAYNLIRMLDVNFIKYPKAYVIGKKIKIIFKKAKFSNDKLEAQAQILRK